MASSMAGIMSLSADNTIEMSQFLRNASATICVAILTSDSFSSYVSFRKSQFLHLNFFRRYFPRISLNFGFNWLAWKKAFCRRLFPSSSTRAEKYFTATSSWLGRIKDSNSFTISSQ